MEKIVEFIQKEIERGLMKGLLYTRLVLNKDNFKQVNIRNVSYLGVKVDIIESNDNKNYFIDMCKANGKIKLIDDFIKYIKL